MATFYSNKCLHIQIFMTGFQITLFGHCALVILSLRIIPVFILFMTLKSVNIHTKNQILDIQHRHKKGVKRNYLVVLCSRHHKYFNGISFYHGGASLNLITLWPFVDPFTILMYPSLKIPPSAAQSRLAFLALLGDQGMLSLY